MKPARALPLLAVLFLGGCPGGGTASPASQPVSPASQPVAPAPTKAPETLAPGTPLPGYEDVRVGQVYTYALLNGRRHDEIVSRTSDALVIRRGMGLGGSGGESQVQVPLLAGATPPDPVASGDKIGEDTIEVSGRKFECSVLEVKGKPQVRSWVASRYPFLVKQTSDRFLMLELKSIEEPEAK